MNGCPDSKRGFTLVETLCAMAVLMTLLSMVGTVLFLGHRQRQVALAYGDDTQQLRVAMQQMAHDLTGTRCERCRRSDPEIEVVGVQPFALTSPSAPYGSGYDWSAADSTWPGDLLLLAAIHIRYSLRDGILRREVWADGYEITSSQVILSGLTADSRIENRSGKVTVTLQRQGEGGSRDAVVRTTFFIP